jgi:hypothetical protein
VKVKDSLCCELLGEEGDAPHLGSRNLKGTKFLAFSESLGLWSDKLLFIAENDDTIYIIGDSRIINS